MAYIGKSPTGTGVRSRYYYTATAGATSLSGADDNSNTLVFSDGNYVDVSLNGIALVAGTDYNTLTANTISGLSALSSGDIVEVVVYDIFTVADTVSAKDGGTFSGNVAMGGTLSVTGASTANGGLNVGTIKEATGTTTAMTIDSTGRILTPARPAFSVYRTDSPGSGVTGHITFNNTHFDIGSNWNTNYFEAPIGGIYMFSWNLFNSDSAGGMQAAGSPIVANIEKSTNGGSSYATSLFEGVTNVTSTTYREQMNLNGLIQLNANDRIRCNVTTGHAFSDTRTDGLTFTGFLVG